MAKSTQHKVFAVCYDKRGRPIAYGENSYSKTHPLMQLFAKKVGLDEKIFLHAEIQAILRCGDKVPHKISVSRYGKTGKPLLAKPCPVCAEAIKHYGIAEVEWTV